MACLRLPFTDVGSYRAAEPRSISQAPHQLSAGPLPRKPSGLPQPTRTILKDSGHQRRHLTPLLSCHPGASATGRGWGGCPDSRPREGAALLARLGAPTLSPQHQFCQSMTHPGNPWYTPVPRTHLRGGAPRLLIWRWAWAMSPPAFCRYMDGK